MKKTTNKTTEEKATNPSLLQPFPFNDGERYLLKLVGDKYVVTYWDCNRFTSDYDDDFVEEEIESIVALKDLGL